MKQYTVAVLGATGAVGQEMIHILEERNFPVGKLVPLASSRSAGKTVTFRGEEDAKAVVHYALVDENENQTAYIPGERGDLEYTAEYMTEVASGIFCKEFILFYGEGLHYYITQELPGKAQDAESEEQIMEDGVLHSAFFQDGRNRFRLVNEIVAANEIGDYDKMDQLLERYYKREFLNSRLFTLK